MTRRGPLVPVQLHRDGMIPRMIRALAARALGAGNASGTTAAGRVLHRHRYTWSGDDPFSGSSLYRCRCGIVRPGM